ncbi:MAG: metallophosphoesterase [Flavobacteriaceae bacterium]|jgi:predicted MPP superfamily phosphohydrolase|nr:metallophosphoesterase [Flavobacteriaceae bacterium]
MKKLQVFAVILLMYLIENAYVFYSWSPIVRGNNILMAVYCILAFTMTFSILGFYGLNKKIPTYIGGVLYKIGTGWFMLIIYAVLLCLLMDIVTALFSSVILITAIQQAWVLITLTSAIALFGYLNYKKKRRVAFTIQVDKVLKKPLKVVMLSDMHLGYAIERAELKSWVELINQEKADLVLIAGDVIDNSVSPLHYYQLEHILNKVESRLGTFSCLGNHEYLAGLTGSLHFLKEAGVHVMQDEVIYLEEENITLVGRDDKTNSRRKGLKALTGEVDPTSLTILLDHQPYALNEAASCGVDLQLSGHTHRGQIWPVSYITDYLFEQSHGYLKKEQTHYYVSSGIGIWGGRYRIGTKSEYAVITIEGKTAN